MFYECHYAEQISHLQELAEKTHDTIVNKMGITNPTEQLEILGDLVQAIPYKVKNEAGPTIVLYDKEGDCSEKSALYAGILQNDPWSIMPGYIQCNLNGTNHRTIAIDIDDLHDGYDTGSNFLVSANNTEFAFFDMTYDSYIGQRSGGVSDAYFYDYGDFRNNDPTGRSNNPPNY